MTTQQIQSAVAKITAALRGQHYIVKVNNGMSSDPARFYFPGLPADFTIPDSTQSNIAPVRVERQWPHLFDSEDAEFMRLFREREEQLTAENLAAYRAK